METAAEATSGIKREIVEEKQSVLEVPSCEFDCDFLIKLQEVSLGNWGRLVDDITVWIAGTILTDLPYQQQSHQHIGFLYGQRQHSALSCQFCMLMLQCLSKKSPHHQQWLLLGSKFDKIMKLRRRARWMDHLWQYWQQQQGSNMFFPYFLYLNSIKYNYNFYWLFFF